MKERWTIRERIKAYFCFVLTITLIGQGMQSSVMGIGIVRAEEATNSPVVGPVGLPGLDESNQGPVGLPGLDESNRGTTGLPGLDESQNGSAQPSPIATTSANENGKTTTEDVENAKSLEEAADKITELESSEEGVDATEKRDDLQGMSAEDFSQMSVEEQEALFKSNVQAELEQLLAEVKTRGRTTKLIEDVDVKQNYFREVNGYNVAVVAFLSLMVCVGGPPSVIVAGAAGSGYVASRIKYAKKMRRIAQTAQGKQIFLDTTKDFKGQVTALMQVIRENEKMEDAVKEHRNEMKIVYGAFIAAAALATYEVLVCVILDLIRIPVVCNCSKTWFEFALGYAAPLIVAAAAAAATAAGAAAGKFKNPSGSYCDVNCKRERRKKFINILIKESKDRTDEILKTMNLDIVFNWKQINQMLSSLPVDYKKQDLSQPSQVAAIGQQLQQVLQNQITVKTNAKQWLAKNGPKTDQYSFRQNQVFDPQAPGVACGAKQTAPIGSKNDPFQKILEVYTKTKHDLKIQSVFTEIISQAESNSDAYIQYRQWTETTQNGRNQTYSIAEYNELKKLFPPNFDEDIKRKQQIIGGSLALDGIEMELKDVFKLAMSQVNPLSPALAASTTAQEQAEQSAGFVNEESKNSESTASAENDIDSSALAKQTTSLEEQIAAQEKLKDEKDQAIQEQLTKDLEALYRQNLPPEEERRQEAELEKKAAEAIFANSLETDAAVAELEGQILDIADSANSQGAASESANATNIAAIDAATGPDDSPGILEGSAEEEIAMKRAIVQTNCDNDVAIINDLAKKGNITSADKQTRLKAAKADCAEEKRKVDLFAGWLRSSAKNKKTSIPQIMNEFRLNVKASREKFIAKSKSINAKVKRGELPPGGVDTDCTENGPKTGMCELKKAREEMTFEINQARYIRENSLQMAKEQNRISLQEAYGIRKSSALSNNFLIKNFAHPAGIYDMWGLYLFATSHIAISGMFMGYYFSVTRVGTLYSATAIIKAMLDGVANMLGKIRRNLCRYSKLGVEIVLNTPANRNLEVIGVFKHCGANKKLLEAVQASQDLFEKSNAGRRAVRSEQGTRFFEADLNRLFGCIYGGDECYKKPGEEIKLSEAPKPETFSKSGVKGIDTQALAVNLNNSVKFAANGNDEAFGKSQATLGEQLNSGAIRKLKKETDENIKKINKLEKQQGKKPTDFKGDGDRLFNSTVSTINNFAGKLDKLKKGKVGTEASYVTGGGNNKNSKKEEEEEQKGDDSKLAYATAGQEKAKSGGFLDEEEDEEGSGFRNYGFRGSRDNEEEEGEGVFGNPNDPNNPKNAYNPKSKFFEGVDGIIQDRDKSVFKTISKRYEKTAFPVLLNKVKKVQRLREIPSL